MTKAGQKSSRRKDAARKRSGVSKTRAARAAVSRPGRTNAEGPKRGTRQRASAVTVRQQRIRRAKPRLAVVTARKRRSTPSPPSMAPAPSRGADAKSKQVVMFEMMRARAMVHAAVVGLTAAAVDQPLAPGKWSVRETLLHLANSRSGALEGDGGCAPRRGSFMAGCERPRDGWNQCGDAGPAPSSRLGRDGSAAPSHQAAAHGGTRNGPRATGRGMGPGTSFWLDVSRAAAARSSSRRVHQALACRARRVRSGRLFHD
jgi:hypothetical protein